ncbi:MAG: hypothetical protein NTW65_06735 [Deltaproteobacteria bacterium]|nr:hypothetical protein [Deltaproteobacteria bacterium]
MILPSKFLICLISFLVFTSSALAFQTQPVGTEYDRYLAEMSTSKVERKLATIVERGVKIFVEPIHEEITQRIYRCEDNLKDKPYEWKDKPNCAKQNFAPKAVIDGTRWNDNPPFSVEPEFILPNGEKIESDCVKETIKLPRKFTCWKKVFETSSEKARIKFFTDKNGVMLNRSHFGDMQFLHSMASRAGDHAQDTKLSILSWAEFAYKVASGSIPADTKLKAVPVSDVARLFPKYDATVENLFLMGDNAYRGSQLRDFAFGSLLHMVQDSFSKSHVSRDLKTQRAPCNCPYTDRSPAAIEKFLVYSAQNPKKHQEEDVYQALKRDVYEYSPNVIDVGKILIKFYEELKDKQKSDPKYSNWDVVKKYLDECVFALKDPSAEADGGKFELK